MPTQALSASEVPTPTAIPTPMEIPASTEVPTPTEEILMPTSRMITLSVSLIL